jgi:hypothetical protein
MKVLAMGPGAADFVKGLELDSPVIETADLKLRNMQKGYDLLVAFNILPRISYRDAMESIKGWLTALKSGGEMLILFPSLEWAANQILFAEKPSPALQPHLWGTQRNNQEVHLAGYTLLQARDIFQTVGLKVTHTSTAIYDIGGHEAELHTIRGVK